MVKPEKENHPQDLFAILCRFIQFDKDGCDRVFWACIVVCGDFERLLPYSTLQM
jgi:hypothetical protein